MRAEGCQAEPGEVLLGEVLLFRGIRYKVVKIHRDLRLDVRQMKSDDSLYLSVDLSINARLFFFPPDIKPVVLGIL